MTKSGIVISYLTLRSTIGIVAIMQPIVLYLGGRLIFGLELQPSMSDYYWTGMRDVFVGVDCAIGIFILCYRGYTWRDQTAALVAGISAILVAFFPTPPTAVEELSQTQVYISIVHAVAAFTFLMSIAYFSLVLFVKYDKSKPLAPKKKLQNICYRSCGIVILAVVAMICIYMTVAPVKAFFAGYRFIFWMEVVAFWAFGLAWMVKGQAILSDSSGLKAAAGAAARRSSRSHRGSRPNHSVPRLT